MIFGVYAIRDLKSGFMSPTVEVNDQVAIRNFSYAVLHNEMFDSFVSDYSFYRVGSFDSNTGIFKSCDPLPELLLEASAVFGRVKKDE